MASGGVVAVKLGQMLAEDPKVPSDYRALLGSLRDSNPSMAPTEFWRQVRMGLLTPRSVSYGLPLFVFCLFLYAWATCNVFVWACHLFLVSFRLPLSLFSFGWIARAVFIVGRLPFFIARMSISPHARRKHLPLRNAAYFGALCDATTGSEDGAIQNV
jgi:hypothetical protein